MNELANHHDRTSVSFDRANRLLRAEAWEEGLACFAAMTQDGHVADAEASLLQRIARIRTGLASVLPTLEVALVRAANGRADLRRYLVSPFVKGGAHEQAVGVLQVLVDTYPELIDDRRLMISLLGRMNRLDDAVQCADDWASRHPDDADAHACRIRLRLRSGRVEEAATIARDTSSLAATAAAQAHLWVSALMRVGDGERASALVLQLGPHAVPDDRAAGVTLQALLADDRVADAIAFHHALRERGLDGPNMRMELARAYLAGGLAAGQADEALEHLRKALEWSPEDVRLNALYGETLLRHGRNEDAISHLEKSCALAPHLRHVRATYARALMYSGKATAAADQWISLVRDAPDSLEWRRPAMASLRRAGREQEAASLSLAFMEQRSASLPETFAEGLARLWQKTHTVRVPEARLDWAWSLRDQAGSTDRADWEKAARWGYLADQLLLDWLECRDERAEEAMAFLSDLSTTEQFLEPLLRSGAGLIVATAHVGPLYAGPMVLDLLGIPARWLASTSGMLRSSYASSLISTSDQTEAQVAKASLKALQAGQALCLAVDGAASVAAPRIRFEGQDITYSGFAARAAHRSGAASIFCAPRWDKGRIAFTLATLPQPHAGESVADYAARWQTAYLHHLRDYLRGEPENLRLSGGIWRHIRPPAKGQSWYPEGGT